MKSSITVYYDYFIFFYLTSILKYKVILLHFQIKIILNQVV